MKDLGAFMWFTVIQYLHTVCSLVEPSWLLIELVSGAKKQGLVFSACVSYYKKRMTNTSVERQKN
jgi:hypothetical protein